MYAKRLLTVFLCLCTVFLFIGVMPIHGESEIYSSALRLHVLANSDSEEDQALKLTVRDSVLEYTSALLCNCESVKEARDILDSHSEKIKKIASATVEAEGYDYSVSVSIGEETYPRRYYGSLAFPSGEYVSLRVMLGDAEGRNWWCVLFPPLCLGAAERADSEDAVEVGFTGEEYKLITESGNGKYKLRFKILEIIEETINK